MKANQAKAQHSRSRSPGDDPGSGVTLPSVAIAVGCPPGCVGRKTFEELTVAAGFAFLAKKLPREALQVLGTKPLLGQERTLVLFCTRRADVLIGETISAFRRVREKAEVIVFADEAHWSGELAIACLKAGARDFLVRGIHDGILEQQIGQAKQSRPAYGAFRLDAPLPKGKVFVAMPYTPLKAYEDWLCGILPALKELGLEPFISTDQRGIGPLSAHVEAQIRESALVIANLTRYGRAFSPSVAMETGWRSIIIQQASEKRVFSDIASRLILRYYNCADLAVQLFFGLKDCITDGPLQKESQCER